MPVDRFVRNMDLLNRDLVSVVHPDAPERRSLVRAHLVEEHVSNFIPEELPLEIRQLLECKAFRVPLVLVVSRDYDPLPIQLPDECGICFLGFYEILDIEVGHTILLLKIAR